MGAYLPLDKIFVLKVRYISCSHEQFNVYTLANVSIALGLSLVRVLNENTTFGYRVLETSNYIYR